VPPLAYQIAAAGSIVLCATVFGVESISYRVRKVWKTSVPALRVGESLRLDTRMHELLGYSPRDGRDVVLFFVMGLPAHQPLEVLPIVDGTVTYSPHDESVREELTLDQLEERVIAGM